MFQLSQLFELPTVCTVIVIFSQAQDLEAVLLLFVTLSYDKELNHLFQIKSYSFLVKPHEIFASAFLLQENFRFPFFVCVIEKLLKLDGIIKFEDARKIPGLLVELKVFTKGTIYCSHKWRELHHPDDRAKTKFQQMKQLLERPALKDARFVWMDFLCVPQEDDETKKMAILSFASYVRCCEYFIILVGTDGNSTLFEYNTRGWCRLERIAAMSPANKRGIKMFVHNASDNSFQQAFIVDGAIPNIATELSPMGGAFTGNSNAEMSQIEPALSMLCDEIISSPPDDFMEKTAELIKDQINLFKINQVRL